MRISLIIVLSALTMSCGGGGDGGSAAPSPCPAVTPSPDAALVPRGLELHRHATIVEVTKKGGAIGVTAFSELPVVELYPPLARAVLDSGYSIVSSDNEGFEAEIFFGDDSVTGAYRLREAECADRVIVRLLFEDKGRT